MANYVLYVVEARQELAGSLSQTAEVSRSGYNLLRGEQRVWACLNADDDVLREQTWLDWNFENTTVCESMVGHHRWLLYRQGGVFMYIYLCVLKAVVCMAEDGILFLVGNVIFLLENREEPSCIKKLVKRSQLLFRVDGTSSKYHSACLSAI